MGCAVAMAALDVVKDENLVQRAEDAGIKFRNELKNANSPFVTVVRGKGLLNAIVIDSAKANGRTAWQFCLLLKSRGLLAKPTHENIIRLAPPLVISEEEMDKGLSILKQCLADFCTAEIPKEHV